MSKSTVSRVGRRASTKAAKRIACQNATRGAILRARRPHSGTNPSPVLFTVLNRKTKRSVDVRAVSVSKAMQIAMVTHKLAKNPANLVCQVA